jgi:hypothetical protein
MDKKQQGEIEPWLVRLSRTRADLAIAAAILLAFFAYKGGLPLVMWLVFLFALFLGLFRLISWALGKRQPHQADSNSLPEAEAEEREQPDS